MKSTPNSVHISFANAVALLFLVILLLSGCTAKPRFRDEPMRTVPKVKADLPPETPVEVGKTWQGVASFYGPDFHGKKTANGEHYDMYGVTAAHKTLPFNTIVEVTNLSNGRKCRVRINDRGPFIENREIDLSYGAARKIGMVGAGLVEVELRIIGTESD